MYRGIRHDASMLVDGVSLLVQSLLFLLKAKDRQGPKVMKMTHCYMKYNLNI